MNEGNNHRFDYIIILGGDGSILWTSKYLSLCNKDTPIFSFNFGRVGFINEFTFDDFQKVIWQFHEFLEKNDKFPFEIEKKNKIIAIVKDENDEIVDKYGALNELVIERIEAYSNWIDIEINGRKLVNLACDGLLISSQQGSTAYNKSVGGPFLYPGMKAMILNILAPFAINFNNMVFPFDSEIKLKISEKNLRDELRVSSDSNTNGILNKNQSLYIQGSEDDYLSLAKFKKKDVQTEWIQKVSKLYKWE